MSVRKVAKPLNANSSVLSTVARGSARKVIKGTPNIKGNLKPPKLGTPKPEPTVDYDLECILTYNDYLQVLMKKVVIENTLTSHSQILKDQLALKSDSLYKMKLTHKKLSNEQQQAIKKIDEIFIILETNLNTLENLFKDNDLLKNFKELNQTLEAVANALCLEQIEPLSDQIAFDQFLDLLADCVIIMEKIKHSGRNFEDCVKLEEEISKLFNWKKKVEKMVKESQQLQRQSAFNYLKNTSDVLALADK